MGRKVTLVCAALTAAVFLALDVSVASATIAPTNTAPSQALCERQGGAYFGPNWVWRLDTTFMTNAGYGCVFSRSEVGPISEALVVDDPRTEAGRAVCTNGYGGTFYTFEDTIGPGPLDHSYAGWGCSFIF
jgi:predicted membrane protein